MTKLLVGCCFAAAMWASDVTGDWSGTIVVADPSSGTTVNTAVKARLAQKDSTVSGTIGRREGAEDETIRNGTVAGDTVRFEVTSPETTGAMRFNLRLVGGERLEGDMKGAIDTGAIAGKVTLTKKK